jgi:hypothetical protein
MRTDTYAELYLLNKNVDSLIRVLQRLEALRVLPGRCLKEYEIRSEELRSVLNVTLLEALLTREQMEHRRLRLQREALDTGRDNLVQ